MHRYSENVLQRIDGYEAFFGDIPSQQMMEEDALRLSYLIPSGLNRNDAINHLNSIPVERRKYHQKWLYLNLLLLPFTAILGIVPGPNVFVMYNGFRCYAHYRAYHGALAVDERKTEFEVMEDECLGQIYQDLQRGNKEQIDDDCLRELEARTDCMDIYHHIHRMRYQVVELGLKHRYPLIA